MIFPSERGLWARFVLLVQLMAASFLLTGCVAPTPILSEQSAILRVDTEASVSQRKLQSLALFDWRRVSGVVTRGGVTIATAEAPRGSSLTFANLSSGDGYGVRLTLFRRGPDGLDFEVGRFERSGLALNAGVNTLNLADFTTHYPAITASPTLILDEPYVGSWPEEGPGNTLAGVYDVAVASDGVAFVADGPAVRKLALDGTLSTLAGSGFSGYVDGPVSEARFRHVRGIAIDATGTLYVADQFNHCIRKISQDGVVTTLAGDGTPGYIDAVGSAARFNEPSGLAVDSNGKIYVADAYNHVIRTVTSTGVVATLAGGGREGRRDGGLTYALFRRPRDVAVTNSGQVYVADTENHCIRSISTSGVVSTLAGTGLFEDWGFADGQGTDAKFDSMEGIAVTPDGSMLYVADSLNRRVRAVTPGGLVTTLAGDGTDGFLDGDRLSARFAWLGSVALGPGGSLYIADSGNYRLRLLSAAGQVTTVAGNGNSGYTDGSFSERLFVSPAGVACATDGAVIVCDKDSVHKIRSDGVVETIAGVTNPDLPDSRGYQDGAAVNARFSTLRGIALSASQMIYVADSGNHAIRAISPGGEVTTLAGNGVAGDIDATGADARLRSPAGVAVGPTGVLYVADTGNHRIKAVTPQGQVTTIAGDGSPGFVNGESLSARFSSPTGIALDAAGIVYVADNGNHCVRAISPSGQVSTIAGTNEAGYVDGEGISARFEWPVGIALSPAGDLYVGESSRIRKVAPSGLVTTFAGGNLRGYLDGPVRRARFSGAFGLSFDSHGNLFVADYGNHWVRRIR